MVINGKNYFLGAYEARRPKQNNEDYFQKLKERQEEINTKCQEAIKDLGLTSVSATLDISKGSHDFIKDERGLIIFKSEVENLYIQHAFRQKEIREEDNGSNTDPYWDNTGNQWLVISEQLYENGFYDDLSDDEVQEMETALAKITAGMDHLSRTQYKTAMQFSDYYGKGSNYFMDSNEVMLELESSTAALKYFGDKYVNESNKDMYNNLVDKYYAHNSEIIEGYQSPFDSFNKAVYHIHAGNNKKPDNDMQLSSDSGIHHSIYLGGIRHTAQEEEEFKKKLSILLSNINDDTFDRIKEYTIDFATKNSNNADLRNYIEKQHQYTYHRIERYWTDLLKRDK